MTVRFDIDDFEAQTMENHMSEYWLRVPEQVDTLNRLVFLEWASARVISGWIPGAPEFTWKCAMSKWVWQNMRIADKLLQRKEELSGNRKISIPSKSLHTFIQDASAADGYFSFVSGWFHEITKDLIRHYETFADSLDEIFDSPTLEILEEILPKKCEQLKWAVTLIRDAVKDEPVLHSVTRWRNYVGKYLLFIGGLDEKPMFPMDKPDCPISEAYGPAPAHPAKPAWLKPGDLMVPPQEFSDSLKIFMWHYATEIRAVDMLCYAFYGIDDMPFEFYVDLSRHLWDESRHHMMGVRRLQQLGYEPRDVPLPWLERAPGKLEEFYSTLTMVAESCSFNRKRKSMNAFYEKGDLISGMTAEIDIIDERRHVKYGKKWLPDLFKRRLGQEATLDEILRLAIARTVESNNKGAFTGLDAEQRKKLAETLTQSELCGKIEFKYLTYDKL
jgi:uncharacterized ferritin-like protein (DUF455 family)